MPEQLALAPVAVLLAGVVLELAFAKVLSAKAKGWLAFLLSILSLGFVLVIWPEATSNQAIDFHLLAWDGPLSLAYHIDGLSQLFAFMGTGIGAAVLLYSISYMGRDKSATRFYIIMLVFIAGLVHLVYSSDMFVLYLSWEVVGLCSFLLVGFWYTNPESAKGARKVLVMTHIAGYGLLAAILLIFAQTGSTLWTDPAVGTAFGTVPFVLMLVAAVAKSVQFPLHTWIPDAMAAPTPVSALLHAACYVKAGVYLIARMYSFGPWDANWQLLVMWIGTITLIVGLFYAMIQSDLKRLLAFHTVSQIGYMLLGLGLGSPLGIAAALLHCLNHGLFKGGLFLCAGAVQHAAGTRDMDKMGGLARKMPWTAGMWLIVAGGIAGVPLLNGFASKWLLYNAALESNQMVPALVAWFGSMLTVFSFLKATTSVFLGEESRESKEAHEAPWPMLAGIGILAAGSIVLGVAPQLAVNYVINPILPAFGMEPVIGVSWLGMTAGATGWFATGGLILAMVALFIGFLFYRMAQPSRQMAVASSVVAMSGGGGAFSGGEPVSGPARLPAHDFSMVFREALAPFYHWVDVDKYYLAIWHGLQAVSARLDAVSRALEKRAAWLILPVALLVVFFGSISGTQFSRVGMTEISLNLVPLVAGVITAFAALLAVSASLVHVRRFVPILALSGVLGVAGLAAGEPYRILLLEASAFSALALVWQSSSSRTVRLAYLTAISISALFILVASFGITVLPVALVIGLMLTGFALKLGLVPLYLWLPAVAEAVPAPVAGLIIGIVDVAAFGELLSLRVSDGWIFAPSEVWLALAVVSALGGALLMLSQRDLKRMLAFSTVQDMGYLLLALSIGTQIGLSGAIIGVTVHALAKALLFSSVGVAEADGTVTLASRGLAARFPLAGVGFLAGALAIIGVPPTAGYLAHWRIYLTAVQDNWLFLAVLLISTALAVYSYARVIGTVWWGAGAEDKAGRAPVLQGVVLVGLPVILLICGLWPGLLGG